MNRIIALLLGRKPEPPRRFHCCGTVRYEASHWLHMSRYHGGGQA